MQRIAEEAKRQEYHRKIKAEQSRTVYINAVKGRLNQQSNSRQDNDSKAKTVRFNIEETESGAKKDL